MRKHLAFLTLALFTVALPGFADKVLPAGAPDPHNVAAPLGAILDLAGSPLQTGNNDWTLYSTGFTATGLTTDITFAFRNDPGFTAFDDASISTGGGPNLFVNGGFETGTLPPWTYDNVYGAPFGGSVTSTGTPGGCAGVTPYPHSGTFGWCDGATQAYDAIDQTVATTPGDVYTISFWQTQNDTTGTPETIYQQLSDNGCYDTTDTSATCHGGTGGNGIDTLVYAQQGIPAPAPEPATITLLATGLIGAGVKRFKERKK